MSESIALNQDCLSYMTTLPDDYFDLAVYDPPFGDGSSQIVNVERERENFPGSGTDSDSDLTDTRKTVTRTGGTWAEKYGKKSSRGTLPRRKNTSMKSFASHAIRSSGAAITSTFRRLAASWYGAS